MRKFSGINQFRNGRDLDTLYKLTEDIIMGWSLNCNSIQMVDYSTLISSKDCLFKIY